MSLHIQHFDFVGQNCASFILRALLKIQTFCFGTKVYSEIQSKMFLFSAKLLTSLITIIFFSTHFKMLHIYSFKPCWKNIFLQNFLHTRRSTIIMTVCDEQVLWNKHDWVSDLAWRYHVYYIHKVISKDPDTVKETQEEREQWPWCVICMGQGPCLPSLADSPINKQFHFSTTTIRLFNNCNFCDWQFCFWLMYKNKLPILMQFGSHLLN